VDFVLSTTNVWGTYNAIFLSVFDGKPSDKKKKYVQIFWYVDISSRIISPITIHMMHIGYWWASQKERDH
jgi:hypothetical protein